MNTFYHSTRSDGCSVTSKQAIQQGIAPDGGLYVSDRLLDTSIDLQRMCNQTFKEISFDVLFSLLGDYTKEELTACVDGAYGPQWDTEAICPISAIGSDWLLELYHGPTSAFKDVALQMLPRLTSHAWESSDGRMMVVTATSGDTGTAALNGFADVDRVAVTVLYPAGKVSDIQRLQMVTQRGKNVAVYGVEGTFDDAQTAAKQLFANRDLAERLSCDGIALSSANSINVGRLAPQVAYYFDSYAQLVRTGTIALGDKVSFCVPTGNFGDVLAGWYAKQLGLPVGRLIVASNANNVLTDFLRTGIYDRRRDFHQTISPSMDILVSSNLERLLYFASDGDVELVERLIGRDLADKGFYEVPARVMDRIREDFVGGYASNAQAASAIKQAWEDKRVLVDPHTAVALHVLEASREAGPHVVLSTASPYKFSADVLRALGQAPADDGLSSMDTLAEFTGVTPPANLTALRGRGILHKDVCAVSDVPRVVEQACKRLQF